MTTTYHLIAQTRTDFDQLVNEIPDSKLVLWSVGPYPNEKGTEVFAELSLVNTSLRELKNYIKLVSGSYKMEETVTYKRILFKCIK